MSAEGVARLQAWLAARPPELDLLGTGRGVSFDEGQWVRIDGLGSQPELNGAGGHVVRREDAHYVIKVKGSGELVKVEVSNLTAEAYLDGDGIAPGISRGSTSSRCNVMSADALEAIDPGAFACAERAACRRQQPATQAGAAMPIDAILEPRELFRSAIRLTDGGEYPEAAYRFLVALLMDWSLNASKMAKPREASAECPPDEPCAVLLRAFVRLEFKKAAYQRDRQSLLAALTQLSAAHGSLGPQSPPATSIEEQHRGRFALCCAHVFLARVDCSLGPYTPSAWAAAREVIVKGAAYVDVQCYLTLQYELAYTARDCGDNREALVWYDAVIANAARASEAQSAHWMAFVANKITPQARQLRFERESGLSRGGRAGQGCPQQSG
jgi:hypothetical protein